MHWVRRLAWRFEILFRKGWAESELDDELRHHLEQEIRENVRAGLSHREARRKALAEFGGVESTKERVRDVRGGRGMDELAQDLRYAIRKLSKSPAFTFAAVVTLGLGVGANVAMFSVLEAALVKAFPYPQRHQLVLCRTTFAGELNPCMSFPDYQSYKEGTDAFQSMGLIRAISQRHTITGSGEPERVTGHWVSAEVFPTLGVTPVAGRGFAADDGQPDGATAVIIGHGLWQRRYGGAPDAVGSTMTLDGQPLTVVGVMPPGFRIRAQADLWLPIAAGHLETAQRNSHSWLTVGRLKEGLSIREAQTQVDVVTRQLAQAYPDSHTTKGLRLSRLEDALAEGYRPALLVLMGATGLILLIACGNVASLLSARGSSRRTELSVRATLGASGGRIARQLFTESAVLAAAAGGLGILLALGFLRLILLFLPVDRLGIRDFGLSTPMLLFALTLSLGTALIFGVGPALAGSRVNPAHELAAGRRVSAGGRDTRLRSGLVVLQVALSVVLLVGSGLLIRSFVALRSQDLGFRTDQLLTADLQISEPKYPEREDRTRFYRELLDEVRSVPGVRAASLVNMVPIRDKWLDWGVWIPGHFPKNEAEAQGALSRTVLPGYFEAMGIPLIAGRDHSRAGEATEQHLVVINQSFVRNLFSGEDPIGRRLALGSEEKPRLFEVIGVVGDSRITFVNEPPRNQMYFHHRRLPYATMELVVRARGDTTALVAPIRRLIRNRDPDVPLTGVATMEEILSEALVLNRVIAVMTALFAVVAIFLTVTGLYGVLAYYVARRTHEIGVRVAVGATARHVTKLVLERGLVLVAAGLALGLGVAMVATRLVSSFLYQVEPTDPLTFAAVAGAFLVVGVAACLLPARRALSIDPVRALQVE